MSRKSEGATSRHQSTRIVRVELHPTASSPASNLCEIADVFDNNSDLDHIERLTAPSPDAMELTNKLKKESPPSSVSIPFLVAFEVMRDSNAWSWIEAVWDSDRPGEPIFSSMARSAQIVIAPTHFLSAFEGYKNRLDKTAIAGSEAEELLPEKIEGWYSQPDLAKKYNVPEDALRKRLERFRHQHDDGWQEMPNPRANEAKYIYRGDAVMNIIKGLKEKSAKRQLKSRPSEEQSKK